MKKDFNGVIRFFPEQKDEIQTFHKGSVLYCIWHVHFVLITKVSDHYEFQIPNRFVNTGFIGY